MSGWRAMVEFYQRQFHWDWHKYKSQVNWTSSNTLCKKKQCARYLLLEIQNNLRSYVLWPGGRFRLLCGSGPGGNKWTTAQKKCWFLLPFPSFNKIEDIQNQGGRSWAGARGAPAEKFGLGRKFKHKHTLFCRKLRFVAIYALFGDLWAKSAFLGKKQCLLGKKCTTTWEILHTLMS